MDDTTMVIWEGLAAAALEEAGMDDGPVCAVALAEALGFEVHETDRRTRCIPAGNVITVRAGERVQRQHAGIAHELGHALLQWSGEDDSEAGAWHVGAALLLPRRAFEAAIRDHGWHLEELAHRHPRASYELIARRLVGLREGAATIIDNGRVTRRLVSPGLLGFAHHRRAELALAREAVAAGGPVERGPYRAVPVCEPGWERAVVVREWWD